jgi:hypothetical protein
MHGKVGVFGTTEKRFIKNKKDDIINPGPGTY